MLAASSSKRNITVWRPSVRPPRLFLTLIERAAHTQRDSPGVARDAVSVHLRSSITRERTCCYIATICFSLLYRCHDISVCLPTGRWCDRKWPWPV